MLIAALLVTPSIAAATERSNELPPCESADSIGVAHMTEDRVITLRIHSLPPGPLAEGELRYAPGDARYDEIKQHLGGIASGETKPVRPWC